MVRRVAIFIILVSVLSSCGQESSGSSGPSYKEIKSMVIDILQTEEGQKAIQEASLVGQDTDQNQLIQMLSTPQGQQMQLAVKEIMTDPSYHKHLQMLMTDPKFAGEFAKAIQKENEQIHKGLLKDPEYQTMLLEVFNNQEFKEILFEVMKSKEYRQQTMTVMQESLEDPIFKLEMLELLKKAVEEASEPNFEEAGTANQEEEKQEDSNQQEQENNEESETEKEEGSE